jgi:hypothetical protein
MTQLDSDNSAASGAPRSKAAEDSATQASHSSSDQPRWACRGGIRRTQPRRRGLNRVGRPATRARGSGGRTGWGGADAHRNGGGSRAVTGSAALAGVEALRGFVASSFLPTDDPDLLGSLLAEIDHMPQHVVPGVAEQMPAWGAESAVAALGRAGTPVLAIDATRLSDLERFATLAPQLIVGRVVGVGHDQMLATPAQSVAMIEGFLGPSAMTSGCFVSSD